MADPTWDNTAPVEPTWDDTAPVEAKVPYAPNVKTPPDGERIIEAQHPAIDDVDRMIADNLADTPEKKLQFLQKRYKGQDSDHPAMDFQIFTAPGQAGGNTAAPDDTGGGFNLAGAAGMVPTAAKAAATKAPEDRVYTRTKGADASVPWLAVTPKGFPDPQEALKYAAGNAYPVAAGLAQGAATAGAGLAGGLPAAVGASAATEGGSEYVRQQLAKAFGIPQETETSPIIGHAIAGALGPLAFGTGASAEQIGAKALASGVPEAEVAATQRGLISRAANKATVGVSAAMSDMPASVIENGKQYLPLVKQLEAQGESGRQQLVKGTMDTVVHGLAEQRDAITSQVASAIDGAGKLVDISDAKDAIRTRIDQLLGQPKLFEGEQAELAGLDKAYTTAFKPSVAGASQEVPDEVSAKEAMRIRSELQNLSDPTGPATKDLASNPAKSIQAKSRQASSAMNDAIEEAVQSGGGPSVKKLWGQYRDLRAIEDYMGPLTGDTMRDQDRAGKLLGNLDSKSNKPMRDRLQNLDQQLGTNVIGNANLLSAAKYFGDDATRTALSGWGSTSTSKTISAKAKGEAIGGLLGGAAGYLGGGATPTLGHLGEGGGGAYLGSKIGGAVNPMLWTPGAMRGYMGVGNAAAAVGRQLTNPGGIPAHLPQSFVPRNAWELLQGNQNN